MSRKHLVLAQTASKTLSGRSRSAAALEKRTQLNKQDRSRRVRRVEISPSGDSHWVVVIRRTEPSSKARKRRARKAEV
jgi:hypothetical protein